MSAGLLAVDGLSDSESTARAIRGLERLVEAGKDAERVLAEIRAVGWIDGNFPILAGNTDDGVSCATVRLERKAEVVRQDYPSFDDLRITLGRTERFRDQKRVNLAILGTGVNVKMHGTAARAEPVALEGWWFGWIRCLKSGFSYENPSTENRGRVIGLRQSYKSGAGQEVVRCFTKHLTKAVLSDKDGGITSSLYWELKDSLSTWLLEEGHAERLLTEMVELAKVADVVNS